jgi:hypothetical protein
VVILLIGSSESFHDAEGTVGLERHGCQLRVIPAAGHVGAQAVSGGDRAGVEEALVLLLLLVLHMLVVVYVLREREAQPARRRVAAAIAIVAIVVCHRVM